MESKNNDSNNQSKINLNFTPMKRRDSFLRHHDSPFMKYCDKLTPLAHVQTSVQLSNERLPLYQCKTPSPKPHKNGLEDIFPHQTQSRIVFQTLDFDGQKTRFQSPENHKGKIQIQFQSSPVFNINAEAMYIDNTSKIDFKPHSPFRTHNEGFDINLGPSIYKQDSYYYQNQNQYQQHQQLEYSKYHPQNQMHQQYQYEIKQQSVPDAETIKKRNYQRELINTQKADKIQVSSPDQSHKQLKKDDERKYHTPKHRSSHVQDNLPNYNYNNIESNQILLHRQSQDVDVSEVSFNDQIQKNSKVICNCKKSRCLKLYCDCFAIGVLCSSECNCQSCHNKEEFNEERYQAMQVLMQRNSTAFEPKIKSKTALDIIEEQDLKQHKKGCNCKKSGCLKRYCECYHAQVKCCNLCKCKECKNRNNDECKDELAQESLIEKRIKPEISV